MSELIEFMDRFGISKEDVLQVSLGAMPPIQPPALRQGWSQSRRYGNPAPTKEVICRLFVHATRCGSQRRIMLDYIDRDLTNHDVKSLRVLCASRNRADNAEATRDGEHRLQRFRSALTLFKELGRFPTDSQVLEHAGTEQISGATYFLRYTQKRLEPDAQQVAPADASKAPRR